MRIARIASPDGVAFVSLEGESSASDPAALTAVEIAEHPFGEQKRYTGRRWQLADARLLAPILPTKIICVGKNYTDHVREMGGDTGGTGDIPREPVIFLKPNTAVIGPNVPIKLPRSSKHVDFEGELAAVVGQPCKDVPAAKAREVLLGYCVANDITARDQQQADGQWTRGKSHDTFCPLGPWIETVLDPSNLAVRTELDGEVKQSAKTSQMLHDVADIVEWISAVMTLLPGDVILTGTPAGVGPMRDGQTVSVTVDGIGTLSNPVVAK